MRPGTASSLRRASGGAGSLPASPPLLGAEVQGLPLPEAAPQQPPLSGRLLLPPSSPRPANFQTLSEELHKFFFLCSLNES